MFTNLTTLLDSFLDTGIPGYDCIVYHNGKCIYRHFNGYSDVTSKLLINGKELYNLYSASKMITCTAALQLYEKGLFDLNDSLFQYMPEFKEMYVKNGETVKKAKNFITIKDLFCMTAGFSYDFNSPQIQLCKKETGGKCPTRLLMKYLAKEPLLFEPGERWEYSLCHDVLAALVEEVSGVRFGEYVSENIFKPLEMNNSSFLLDNAKQDTVSTLYRYNSETQKAEVRSKHIDYRIGDEYESGGAGCVSTVEDYIKFLEGLRTEKLINEKTLDIMANNQLTDKQAESYWVKNSGYGLGVCCYANGNNTAFGWGGAAGAYPLIDREHGLTFFYIQHVLGTDNDFRNSKMYDFFNKEMTKLAVI